MIVFNHDLLFVHSPKTAGTSIIAALETSLPGAKVAGVQELGTHHPHLDQALTFARAVTGQNRFKCMFVVARDPFDREASMYVYFRDVLHASPLATRNLNNVGLQAAVQLAARYPFPEYLRRMQASFGTCDLWRSRYYYESEMSGPIPDLHILRFENIAAELGRLLEGYLSAPLELPFLNRGERGDADLVYDEETRAIVAESYAWMFARGLYADSADEATGAALRELASTIPNIGELFALDRALGEAERRVGRIATRLGSRGRDVSPSPTRSRRPRG